MKQLGKASRSTGQRTPFFSVIYYVKAVAESMGRNIYIYIDVDGCEVRISRVQQVVVAFRVRGE
jgi:pyruvate kinase